jgi:hypothetical protein
MIADANHEKTPLWKGAFSMKNERDFSQQNQADPTGDEYAGDIHVLGPSDPL